MADAEHVDTARRGAEAIREWRRQRRDQVLDLVDADLSGANLRDADLCRARLSGADLERADLRGAALIEADLDSCNLRGAVLDHADLTEADLFAACLAEGHLFNANLSGANLLSADLAGADLGEANLFCARMEGANLTGAVFENTLLARLDLSRCVGLEAIIHRGPSTVGTDTLFLSRRLPEVFLRGCGVPRELVDQLPAIVASMEPIQFFSCFISYSSRDSEFAELLHGRLSKEGLRIWFAPRDMRGGRRTDSQIDEAIRVHDRVLLVLSAASMDSAWVRREIKRARTKEKSSRRDVLFPISLVPFGEIQRWECLDGDSGEDLAEQVRTYHVSRFESWKNRDSFEQAFTSLLRDLRADRLDPSRR